MLVGFVKYLPPARMDCTIPRFTVSCSQCAASRSLLRFRRLSSDSMTCKGASCVQSIVWQIRRQPGIRSHVLGDEMSPSSRELGVSRTVTALSRAVSSVLTSNAGKEQRLPGSSACSRGCTHGKGDCRKCGFGGRGRTTIPAAAACSFSAFSRSYLSPKRYAPADGQTVNLGIIFGLFSPCALRSGSRWYCGMGKSLRRVLCAFGRGHLLHFWI